MIIIVSNTSVVKSSTAHHYKQLQHLESSGVPAVLTCAHCTYLVSLCLVSNPLNNKKYAECIAASCLCEGAMPSEKAWGRLTQAQNKIKSEVEETLAKLLCL